MSTAEDLDIPRPRTRADCHPMRTGDDGELQPCPWVSCRHHLYLDTLKRGKIHLNFPDLEVWEMAETCSLDLADRDGMNLEEVGEALGLTKQAMQQLEDRLFPKVRRRVEYLLEIHDDVAWFDKREQRRRPSYAGCSVRDVLVDEWPLTVAQIAERIDRNRVTVKKRLYALERDGIVERCGMGELTTGSYPGGRRPTAWRLVGQRWGAENV